MAVPVWPSSLPVESEGSGGGASYAAPLASETEGGPPIMRPRPGPRSTELQWVSKPLTGEQWSAFDQFARLDLRHGTLVFEMPVLKPGAGYVSRKCQIKGGQWATDSSAAPHVRITFALVVWNY